MLSSAPLSNKHYCVVILAILTSEKCIYLFIHLLVYLLI